MAPDSENVNGKFEKKFCLIEKNGLLECGLNFLTSLRLESQARPHIRRLQCQPRNRIGARSVRFGNGSLSMDIWARKGCAIVVGSYMHSQGLGIPRSTMGSWAFPGPHNFQAYLSLARNPAGANCWPDTSYGDCKANFAIWSGQESFASGTVSSRWIFGAGRVALSWS